MINKAKYNNFQAKLLHDGLVELGLIPSEAQVYAFITYIIELKRWNKAYNLTGLTKDKDIIIKHFFDSVLYIQPMPKGEITIADIGTGAGFPGIPIKIIRPEVKMFLIEPSKKKASFLRHIVRELKLERIDVVEKPIEQIRSDQTVSILVDVAVTRALFSIKGLVKKASHIVKEGGIFILNKGPKIYKELKMLRNIRYEVIALRLPFSDIKRYIIVVKR